MQQRLTWALSMRMRDIIALLGDARSYQLGRNSHHTDQRKALEKLADVCVNVCVYVYVYVHVYICVYMCAHVYICVFVDVCMWVCA